MFPSTASAREYETAWEAIGTALGPPFNDHLDEARALVGDAALLGLLERFPPGEVIIACGIAIANIVLEECGRPFFHKSRPSKLERALAAAQAAHGHTPEAQQLVADTKARRDGAERAFLDAAKNDPRVELMRARVNHLRQRDGLSPL